MPPHTRPRYRGPYDLPLPRRIVDYLRTADGPQHYTVIARQCRGTLRATVQACGRMARTGRLRWVAEGTYGLGEGEGTR